LRRRKQTWNEDKTAMKKALDVAYDYQKSLNHLGHPKARKPKRK